MKRKLMDWTNAFLEPLGVKLYRQGRFSRERLEDGLIHLVKKNCKPKTCIDVGVAHGTPGLYRTFPQAKHLLVEPLAEYEPKIRKIMKSYDCHYEKAAAGERQGELVIHVKEKITGSSVFAEQPNIKQGNKRTVPVVRLDQVCKDQKITGPYIVKIDVEGAEMSVVEGSTAIIHEVLAFILEITFVAKLVGAPEAGDIIRFMAGRNFVLYDFFDLRMREDQTLFQADALFVPKDSPLRAS